jgi:hypothetical protein
MMGEKRREKSSFTHSSPALILSVPKMPDFPNWISCFFHLKSKSKHVNDDIDPNQTVLIALDQSKYKSIIMRVKG